MASRDEDFSAYVAERRPQLYRTAYLLCGDPHHAEDVVQLTLAKLYASWRRVRRADSIDAYARRAIINTVRDEARRPWRRERSVAEESAYDSASGTASGRASGGLTPEDSDQLWTALRGLAPGQRQVVVLRHFWGLSVEETAADLGISPGTVKSQTAAALTNLRDVLVAVSPRGESL